MKLKRIHKVIIVIIAFVLVYGATFGVLKYLDTQKRADISIDTVSGDLIKHNTYIETADGAYIGEVYDNAFEGSGQFNFLSGEIYVGEFSDSSIDGEGRMVFKDIGVYDGEYTDNKRDGYGEFT